MCGLGRMEMREKHHVCAVDKRITVNRCSSRLKGRQKPLGLLPLVTNRPPSSGKSRPIKFVASGGAKGLRKK